MHIYDSRYFYGKQKESKKEEGVKPASHSSTFAQIRCMQKLCSVIVIHCCYMMSILDYFVFRLVFQSRLFHPRTNRYEWPSAEFSQRYSISIIGCPRRQQRVLEWKEINDSVIKYKHFVLPFQIWPFCILRILFYSRMKHEKAINSLNEYIFLFQCYFNWIFDNI